MKKRIDMLIYMLAFSPWIYWILAGAAGGILLAVFT